MKRKVAMMSLAVMAGMPHAVCAKGAARGSSSPVYSSWDAPYMPHYGSDGGAHPLMDHLPSSAVLPRRNASNEWRLEFAPPAPVSRADDPLTAKDKRVGVRFSLDF